MNRTIATTGAAVPVSLEEMTRAMREIDLLPKLDEWVLIDPQGRVYKGRIEDIAPVVMAQHPLLKRPSWREVMGAA